MTIPTCQSWAANAVCAALMVDINGAWFCPRCDTAPCRCEGSSGHRQRRVTKPMLEAKLGRPSDQWTPPDVATLRVIATSLTRGEATIEDEFPDINDTLPLIYPKVLHRAQIGRWVAQQDAAESHAQGNGTPFTRPLAPHPTRWRRPGPTNQNRQRRLLCLTFRLGSPTITPAAGRPPLTRKPPCSKRTDR